MAGSIVQSRESSASAGGASIALAFSSDNSAHNVIWVVGHAGDQTDAPTVADSLTNTYSAAIDTVTDGDNNNRVRDWSVSDSLAGANTVTVSFTTAPGFRGIYIAEITGVQNAANDGHNGRHQLNPGTATDAVTSLAATNTATAFMIGLSLDDGTGNAPTIGTGFTLDKNIWTFGGAGNVGTVEFKTGVAPASNAATFTAINAADDPNTVMAMFKEVTTAQAKKISYTNFPKFKLSEATS